MIEYTETFREINIDGSALTWDNVAKAGMLNVEPMPDGFAVARTIAIVDGSLLVDLDVDGKVRGIESIGAPIDLTALLKVIRWMNSCGTLEA